MAYSRDLPKMAMLHYGLKLQWYLTWDIDWRFGMVWYGFVGIVWYGGSEDYWVHTWRDFNHEGGGHDWHGWLAWMASMDD